VPHQPAGQRGGGFNGSTRRHARPEYWDLSGPLASVVIHRTGSCRVCCLRSVALRSKAASFLGEALLRSDLHSILVSLAAQQQAGRRWCACQSCRLPSADVQKGRREREGNVSSLSYETPATGPMMRCTAEARLSAALSVSISFVGALRSDSDLRVGLQPEQSGFQDCQRTLSSGAVPVK
jgi:hypothetical protein